MVCFVGELARIDELVDHVEHINTLIRKRYLASGSLDERAIESTTKVIGVEDKEILVNVESFRFFPSVNLNRDNALEAASV